MNVKPHPASEIFPLMQESEFRAFVADIKEHGQRDPIMLYQGQILDGRNRYRACSELGLTPTFLEWRGEGTAEAFVISMNLHRRHLNESQRAMVAARVANISHGEVGNGRQRVEVQIPTSTAAQMLNTHRSTVFEAKKVLRDGTKEEVRAVENGEAAVSTVATNIRKRTREAQPTPPTARLRGGDRVKLKDGLTMEAVARQGLALESEGALPERAADALGIGRATYSHMRDVINLVDRSDLLPRDSATARSALSLMNETRQVVGAWEMIEPLTARLWGHRRGPRANLEAMRLASFERAFGALIQTCSTCLEIDLPYLTTERAALAVEELAKAEKSVRDLRNQIKEQCL